MPRPTLLSTFPSLQTRNASFSLRSLRSALSLSRTSTEKSDVPPITPPTNADKDANKDPKGKGKGIFDMIATEDEGVRSFILGQRTGRKPTFHKSSTANFKTSQQKLNDLARLIAGRGVDEGVLQLKVSPKKQASRLLSMLTLARDHAIAKGLHRDNLIIAQAWTTPGPSLPRLDIKGRGRRGIKHHPSSKLHVLLAEGETREEKGRKREEGKWRRMIRGSEEGGVGVLSLGRGGERKIINAEVGRWKW